MLWNGSSVYLRNTRTNKDLHVTKTINKNKKIISSKHGQVVRVF